MSTASVTAAQIDELVADADTADPIRFAMLALPLLMDASHLLSVMDEEIGRLRPVVQKLADRGCLFAPPMCCHCIRCDAIIALSVARPGDVSGR